MNIRLEIRDHVLSNAVDESLNNTVNIKCVSSGRYFTIYNSRNQTDTSLSTSTNYSLLLKKLERFIRLDKKKYKNNKEFIYFRILKPEYVYIVYKK